MPAPRRGSLHHLVVDATGVQGVGAVLEEALKAALVLVGAGGDRVEDPIDVEALDVGLAAEDLAAVGVEVDQEAAIMSPACSNALRHIASRFAPVPAALGPRNDS